MLRRQKGSEVRLDIMMQSEPTEKDEAKMLHKVDLDEMASKSCLPCCMFSQKCLILIHALSSKTSILMDINLKA